MKKAQILAFVAVVMLTTSCSQSLHLTSVSRTRILIDSTYDAVAVDSLEAFLAPYKACVDSIMSPVVGSAAHDMAASRPESDLSNLLADILLWSGAKYGEHPDFAVYNMGGIRAAFSRGDVTRGDVLDVAPFENKVCFLTLSGSKVLELFSNIASVGGEGVSKGVRLVITDDGQLLSASVGGKAVDPARSYRVATLDYLAQGNDHLTAFKDNTDMVAPKGEQNNVRFIIENYFGESAAKGKPVASQVEGRIVVKSISAASQNQN